MDRWNSDLYDDKIGFVSRLGMDLLRILGPQPGERILDLGCGTGDLTNEIAAAGALPVGIDSSPSMIEKARQKYPGISFSVGYGEKYRTDLSFDAVFSNAALHWMKRASDVASTVWLSLRPGGRFVAEFGGKGNVGMIIGAITAVLADYGVSASERNPWYYPSLGEYSTLLERQGFRVVLAEHFDRPTPLEDGENGLKHWLDMFAGSFFADISVDQKEAVYGRVAELLKPLLYSDGVWTADYKRLRVVAVKE